MFKNRLSRRSIIIILVIIIVGFSIFLYSCINTSKLKDAQAQSSINPADAVVELTFNFTRQSGYSTNQFAVWVEDLNGQYIRTIYATRFTANGGWRRRETSLPLWVKQSGISEKNRTQIDVLSSATPRTGNLTYIWDGNNDIGEAVSRENFVIILEGTLRGDKQVYYRTPVNIGQGISSPKTSVEYIGDAGSDRAMINDVIVRVLR